MQRTLLSLLALSTLAFADSSSIDSDPGPIGGYAPKVWPAVVALALYAISAIIFWIRFFREGRQRYMLVGCIGMTTLSLGFVVRILDGRIQGGENAGAYTVMTLLILLSPCAFLAQDYVLIQHLAKCLPADAARRCFILPANRIVIIFVATDVTTFLLQSAGGGLEASSTQSSVNLGQKLALIGLILQLISFGLFTVVAIIFGGRLRRLYPEVWSGASAYSSTSQQSAKKWRTLYFILVIGCTGALIRSVYRIIEFAQGFTGYLTTHEGFFYCLDAVPLFFMMSLYCIFWPPAFLEPMNENDMLVTKEIPSPNSV